MLTRPLHRLVDQVRQCSLAHAGRSRLGLLNGLLQQVGTYRFLDEARSGHPSSTALRGRRAYGLVCVWRHSDVQRTESMISPVFGCIGVYTPSQKIRFFGFAAKPEAAAPALRRHRAIRASCARRPQVDGFRRWRRLAAVAGEPGHHVGHFCGLAQSRRIGVPASDPAACVLAGRARLSARAARWRWCRAARRRGCRGRPGQGHRAGELVNSGRCPDVCSWRLEGMAGAPSARSYGVDRLAPPRSRAIWRRHGLPHRKEPSRSDAAAPHRNRPRFDLPESPDAFEDAGAPSRQHVDAADDVRPRW